MIINGQYNITASKELWKGGCEEARKIELATWEAYVVRTLELVQLHNISKFSNYTIHLNHAQQTWGNQIISCCNIWLSSHRPTCSDNKVDTRRNNAICTSSQYAVRNS